MKRIITVILTTVAVAVLGISASAQGQKKIGMKRAQAIAASHAKGLSLKAKELEHENGKWIYSFEFKNRDGSIREVNVNAYTGAIVGVEHENAKAEAAEEKGEKKKN